MKSHKLLIEEAEQAIDEVFGDDRVSQRQTISDLRGLEDNINIKISAIEGDLKRTELGRKGTK